MRYVCIAGMHRSGTSLVSRMVNLLGVDLGPEDQMISAGSENPKGFWENSNIKRLNEEVLERMGGTWSNPPMLEEGWESSSLLDDLRKEAGSVIRSVPSGSVFGWKDPRNSLTLPFWRTVVNIDKCIVVVRRPEHVAKSLITRNGFAVEKTQYLWLRYTLGAVAAAPNCLIVLYEHALSDPVETVEKLVEYLELPEPTEKMKQTAAAVGDEELNRSSRGSPLESSLGLANSVYRIVSLDAPERLLPILGAIGDGPVSATAMKQLADERSVRAERLEGQVAEERRRVQQLENELAVRNGELGNLEEDVAAERARAEQLKDELYETWTEVETLKSHVESAEAASAELRQRANDAEREIEKLKKSTSWAVMKPFRIVSWQVKNVVRRQRGADSRGGSRRREGVVVSAVLVRSYKRYTPQWIKGKLPQGLKRSVHRHLDSRHTDPDEHGRGHSPDSDVNLLDRSVQRRELDAGEAGLVDKNITIGIVSWDVCHNPLGRAYLLAEALSPYFNVLLLGPAFPRFGGKVWEPLEEAAIPVVPLPALKFPGFIDMSESVADGLQADVIIACKLRLPSLLLGCLGKARGGRPLLVDVDDYEMAFVEGEDRLALEDVMGQPESRWEDPDSDVWTRYAEGLLRDADEVLVASDPLKERYGGLLIPHARNEKEYDPDLYDKEANRSALGFGRDDRVILFAGTVRTHKGLFELLEAVDSIEDPSVKMLVVGRFGNVSRERKRLQEAGRLVEVGNRPLSELPVYLSCADMVVLPQHLDSPVVEYQLPAKVVDALAFGLPILATESPPLLGLIQEGLIETTTLTTLREDLLWMLAQEEDVEKRVARREYFLRHFSYSAVGRSLAQAIWHQLEAPASVESSQVPAIAELEERVKDSPRKRPESEECKYGDESGLDIVLVWKQHDMFLYGRRPEMLVRYLANEAGVRRVAVVEPPLSSKELWEWSKYGIRHQNRAAYVEWLRKSWGIYNDGKIKTFAFTYGVGEGHTEYGGRFEWPNESEYIEALSKFFIREDLRISASTFIVCPLNEWIPRLVDEFSPSKVIADVVDDHRTWPGIGARRVADISRHYARVLGLSDFVTVNCETVMDSMREFHHDVRILPNGIDTSILADYPVSRRFRDMRDLEGPIIGYVGNLEKKIDVGLVRALARERPEWNIVLVGSIHANPGILELDEFDNVYFPGVVAYEEAKHWIRSFDVGIMPHRDIPLTRNMSPLKLYVYLGLGVPVVSTDIMNIPTELAQYVTVATEEKQFVGAIESCLTQDSPKTVKVPECVIGRNSWEKRVESLLAWLD